MVLVAGPFCPLRSEHGWGVAKGLPVIVRRSVPDSLHLNPTRAWLVVAMAGYNTTAEILSLGRRALLVPRDQAPNAPWRATNQAVSPHGAGSTGSPRCAGTTHLAEAMLRTLRSAPFQPDEAPDLRGRERAVQHLLARGADGVDPPATANGPVPTG